MSESYSFTASKKLSGAQFRERAKQKQTQRQKLLQQIPKLDTFFVSPGPSSGSLMPDPVPLPEDISSPPVTPENNVANTAVTSRGENLDASKDVSNKDVSLNYQVAGGRIFSNTLILFF